MTPKQRYEERKRLKAERLFLKEQRLADLHDDYERRQQQDKDMLDRFVCLVDSLERIASVMELWADKQTDGVANDQ